MGITTLALDYSTAAVQENTFQTGNIKINLNNGTPVIKEGEVSLWEPGMTVEKEFFIKNQGTWDVYYKLYFEDVKGKLADVLEVSVTDQDDVILYEGTVSELKESAKTGDYLLRSGEKKELTMSFHFPEEAGNENEDGKLSFHLSASAVQTKNNPEKQFD